MTDSSFDSKDTLLAVLDGSLNWENDHAPSALLGEHPVRSEGDQMQQHTCQANKSYHDL